MRLDVVASAILVVFSIALIAYYINIGYYLIDVPAIILAATGLYWLLKDRIHHGEPDDEGAVISPTRIGRLSTIMFFIAIGAIVYLSWSNLYYRPTIYFAFVLVAVLSIAISALYLDKNSRFAPAFVMLKIMALNVVIAASLYYQFPGTYGVDPWIHEQWIKESIASAHITSGVIDANGYYNMPVFHLLVMITSLTTGLSILDATFFSVGLAVAISCVFVYFVGRQVAGVRIGLLAALAFSMTPEFIERARDLIPNSLGMVFFLALVFLFLSNKAGLSKTNVSQIGLSSAVILTHYITASATLICMVVIYLFQHVTGWLKQKALYAKNISLAFIAAFGMFMLFVWMSYSFSISSSFFTERIWFIAQLLFGEQSMKIVVNNSLPYDVVLFNKAGFLILLFFGTIGSLYYLYPKNSNRENVLLITLTAVFLFIIYAFNSINPATILPYRWYIILYALLAVLAMANLCKVSWVISKRYGSFIIVVLLLAAAFFNMTNDLANNDSPLVFNNAIRGGYTQSELTAIERMSSLNVGCPVTDLSYSQIIPYVAANNYTNLLNNPNKVYIIRNYYMFNPDWNDQVTLQIHDASEPDYMYYSTTAHEFRQTLDDKLLIYDDGNVKSYITV